MAQRAQEARSATDDAHSQLAQLALAAMRIAAKASAVEGVEPRWFVAARLWDARLPAQAATAAVGYVDALAALAPEGPPSAGPPPGTSRDAFVVPIAGRIAAAEVRARAAARNFARATGLAVDHPEVVARRRATLAIESSRVAHDAAVGAWRAASKQRMADLGVVLGWRRVAEPGACGACLALMDGSVHPVEEDMVIHTRDRCVAEPVVARVNDREWGHPTGEEIFRAKTVGEQDALFTGRGGATKARLIRDGHIDFGDLAQIATERLGQTPLALTETPLAALQAPDA